MTINLNFDETVSVYATVISILRGIYNGEIDSKDPDIIKIIEMAEVDEEIASRTLDSLQEFMDEVTGHANRGAEKLGILEAAYTPKNS